MLNISRVSTTQISSILLIFALFALVTSTGCRRIEGCTDPTSINFNPDADRDNGTCVYTGSASFWTDGDGTCGSIDIAIDGNPVGTLSDFFPTGLPTCGQNPGTLTVELEPGSYPYHANDDCGVWDHFITITSAGCQVVKLNQ